MKKKLMIAFIVAISVISTTKSEAQQQWLKVVGTNYYNSYPFSISECYDKGYLVVFRYQNNSNAQTQTCLMKTDVNGNVLWLKTFGHHLNNTVTIPSVKETPDGGFILYGNATNINKGIPAPFIMKLNACMEKEWCRLDTLSQVPEPIDVITLPDGGYAVLQSDHYQSVKINLKRLDASGKEQWNYEFASNNPSFRPTSVELKYNPVDHTFLLWGSASINVSIDSLSRSQPYLSKISLDGDLLWEFYTIPDLEYRNVYIRNEALILPSGNIIAPLRNVDGGNSLLSVNSNGEFLSIQNLEEADSVKIVINSMELFDNDKLLIGMQHFSDSGWQNGSTLRMTDFNGNTLHEAVIDSTYTRIVFDISTTFDNKILSVNSIEGPGFSLTKFNDNLQYDSVYNLLFDYDSRCDGTISSSIIEIDCSTYGIDEQTTTLQMSIMPNPASDYLAIQLPDMLVASEKRGSYSVTSQKSDYIKGLFIEIYDIHGRKVYHSNWEEGKIMQLIDVHHLKGGMYLVNITGGSGTIAKGKVVISR